jgi:hypothetical protein
MQTTGAMVIPCAKSITPLQQIAGSGQEKQGKYRVCF